MTTHNDNGPAAATLILFTYNQARYVREAVRSVLNQQDVRLDILISDDCSIDGTYEILQTEVADYSGPHNVSLSRNHKNFGLIPHVNDAVMRSRNDIVIVGAGDDISLPHRAKRILEAFERDAPLLVHSRCVSIDAHGNELEEQFGETGKSALAKQASARRVAKRHTYHLGATAAWHLDLFRKFGPIRSLAATEDAVLEFRAALEDRLMFVDEVLVRYRVDKDRLKFSPLCRLAPTQALRRRLKAIAEREAIFTQRLSDLEVASSHVDTRLRQILVGAIDKQRCRRDVHDFGVARTLWRRRHRPFTAIAAAVKELNFLRKIR